MEGSCDTFDIYLLDHSGRRTLDTLKNHRECIWRVKHTNLENPFPYQRPRGISELSQILRTRLAQ